MLMGCTDAMAYLVMYNQLRLECFVRVQDVLWHSSCSRKGYDQWSNDLVKAFVYVDTGCSDLAPSGLFELEFQLGKVPTFPGSCPGNSCEHCRVSPCAYPLL